MSFGGDTPLGSRLRDGQFLILIEYNSPPEEQPFDSAVAIGVALAKGCTKAPEIVGMAVTDRCQCDNTHDPVATAARLAEASGTPPLMHISGKGSDKARVRDLLARAHSEGISNVFAVTGNRSEHHPEPKPGSRKVAPYQRGYLDSVETLDVIKNSGRSFLSAAAVNPFKYNPLDQYLQYYKMIRKLEAGADFLISQAGWDMKKLQELQWYLQMRDIGVPVLARLMLLSAEDIERIHEGVLPGIHVSKNFAAVLQRESNISRTQSLAAQLTRLGLQVSGCKLLGYNGVQITGSRDIKTLEMAMSRVRECLDTYQEYPAWLQAWNEFHDFMPFAPMPDAYYVFRNLLNAEHQMYQQGECSLTPGELPAPDWLDRVRAAVLPRLLAERTPQAVRKLARSILLHGCELPADRIRHCQYLCPAPCPKGLVHGACGGSFPDGTCEFGHGPCFFHRVLAVAAHRRELDRLEKGISHD